MKHFKMLEVLLRFMSYSLFRRHLLLIRSHFVTFCNLKAGKVYLGAFFLSCVFVWHGFAIKIAY